MLTLIRIIIEKYYGMGHIHLYNKFFGKIVHNGENLIGHGLLF
ncbi:hypothetical protein [Bacillus sp. FJAT-27231]|nr:hypothetical protein [Bacillus sp. FJAT-27231]